ncbi:MAG: hypothetical protein FRX49_03598 [Trebouxia sp. A1-2]|nr:MAG: hypothetical protein FRX49_03598 [Trebouxia sp. A1-2]
MHCLLTVQTSTPRSPITKAVQAATAVAVGGIPIPKREQADAIMGTSPEGSFEFEMQRFMQGHIANKQSKRRRSGHRSSSGTLPVVHTLTRVEKPIPTHRHPLAGLWRSTGMLPTCIMTVRYNFSLRAASIVATQVMNHSSLLHRWAVRAAPIAKPWLPDHVAMLTRQAELSLLSGDFDHLDDDGGTPLPAKEVVQIFQGEVVTSRLAEPTVLPSHLWLYADGTFGVIFDTWDHEPEHSTTHQAFVLQHVIDKHRCLKAPFYLCFVDLKSAYDRVQWPLLWNLLQRLGVQFKMLGAVQSLYDKCCP